jgi:hypothetical protein
MDKSCPCAWLSTTPWRYIGEMDVQLRTFLSSALDEHGGEWSGSCPGRFTPGKEPPVPVGKEARWAPEPVWTWWWREKFLSTAENRILGPRSYSPQSSCYIDWAITAVKRWQIICKETEVNLMYHSLLYKYWTLLNKMSLNVVSVKKKKNCERSERTSYHEIYCHSLAFWI